MTANAEERIVNYLGLAQKAGKLAAGDAATLNAVRDGSAHLVVCAGDAAPAVRRDLAVALDQRNVPVMDLADKQRLGWAVGKSHRGMVAVLDAGFAGAILKIGKQDLEV